MYKPSNQIKLKTSIITPNLCDYSDAYIPVSGSIEIAWAGDDDDDDDDAKRADQGDKGVIFKNCPPFPDCISEINNTQIDNAKNIDSVVPIYSLIDYSGKFLKTSESLRQYYRDKPSD